MAAARVFGIVELLEMILDDVDERTLLLSQGFNRTFASTIADSAKYQNKLFFTGDQPLGSKTFKSGTSNLLFLSNDLRANRS